MKPTITMEEILAKRNDPYKKKYRMYLAAKEFAQRSHFLKVYGIHAYTKHLRDVESVLEDFGYANDTIQGLDFRMGAYLHDSKEDAGISFNDLKNNFGIRVAEMVHAVTDEKGKNRKQRKPDKLYDEMRQNSDAIILKLADRIANMEHSIESREKGDMYVEEHEDFKKKLWVSGVAEEMWEYIEVLLKKNAKMKEISQPLLLK